MKTRAKFHCNSVTKRVGWGNFNFLFDAEFSAVTSGNEENKDFFAASPAGNIKLSTVKDDLFEVGKDYYVDFTKCDES